MAHLYSQLLSLLNVTAYRLEKDAGLGKGMIARGIETGGAPSAGTLLKIKGAFPTSATLLNPILKEIEEGVSVGSTMPPQKPKTEGERLRHNKAFLPKEDIIRVPFLESGMKASPGSNDGDDTGMATHYREVSAYLFADADGILPVHDMSMCPTYFPGQEVALVFDTSTFFEFGKVYSLLIIGNKIPILKRIYESEKDDCIELYSDNTETYKTGARAGKFIYPTQVLHLDQIARKFRPIGAQGRDTNKPIVFRGAGEIA